MINLTNTTFIIPLYIDSEDRLSNCKNVLGYLNHHFKTNVIIHELIQNESKLNFLNEFKNIKIRHFIEKINNSNYHRTRQLNEMLSMVKTKVVCNYDIDVILPVSSYVVSETLIKEDIFDVVYPYGFGKYQFKISTGIDNNKFQNNFSISDIDNNFLENEYSAYGHCIFFNTESYKSIGGENENFISYGPEDTERYKRCHKFGLKVHRINDYVYHFEHSRTNFSNKNNPDYYNNQKLFNLLSQMNDKDFVNYYKIQEYCEKYSYQIKKFKKVDSELYIKDESTRDVQSVVLKEDSLSDNTNSLESKDNQQKKENIKTNYIVFNNVSQSPKCACGQLIDKISYNYCTKCGRLY